MGQLLFYTRRSHVTKIYSTAATSLFRATKSRFLVIFQRCACELVQSATIYVGTGKECTLWEVLVTGVCSCHQHTKGFSTTNYLLHGATEGQPGVLFATSTLVIFPYTYIHLLLSYNHLQCRVYNIFVVLVVRFITWLSVQNCCNFSSVFLRTIFKIFLFFQRTYNWNFILKLDKTTPLLLVLTKLLISKHV